MTGKLIHEAQDELDDIDNGRDVQGRLGDGAIGGVAVGIAMFTESASVISISPAALIVAGIVGLKLTK